MSQSQKIKLWPRERYDLPDWAQVQDFIEDDFQLINTHLLGGGAYSWVTKNFDTTHVGGAGLGISVAVANSTVFSLTDTSDLSGTYFIGDGGLSPLTATITDNSTNYIHIRLSRATSSAAERVFWDPSLNDGEGGEYKQIVDTAEIKEAELYIITTGWSTDVQDIPIARAVTLAGTITELYDERNLFFRLGKGATFSSGYISTPVYTQGGGAAHNDLTASGAYSGSVSVSYIVEVTNIGTPDLFRWSDDGGGTWTSTVSMTGSPQLLNNNVYIDFSSILSHEVGDQWDWDATANLGAGYRYNLASSSEPDPDVKVDSNAFTGGDKELDNYKEWMDLVMTTIAEIKFGGAVNKYWYEAAPTNLSNTGVIMTGGGDISWNLGATQLSFTANFTFLIPGTPYTNYIAQATWNPITPIVDGDVYYIDIDKTSSASLTPIRATSATYVAAAERKIILRRVGNAVYIGNGALRLDDGETGQLIRPLTNEMIDYVGAPNEATNTPDYSAEGYTVHDIGNADNLTLAIAKLGEWFTNRTGDDITGIITWSAIASAIFANGAAATFSDGAIVNFNNSIGTAPFTVVSTDKVINLNADKLDGFTIYDGMVPVADRILVTQANGWLYTPNSAPTTNYHVANKKYVDDSVPAVVTDHGALTGLGDYDHPQYAKLSHVHNSPSLQYYRTLTTNNNTVTYSASIALGGYGLSTAFFDLVAFTCGVSWNNGQFGDHNNLFVVGGTAVYLVNVGGVNIYQADPPYIAGTTAYYVATLSAISDVAVFEYAYGLRCRRNYT